MVIAGLGLAALLELVGLALAGVGFRRTWTEHAHGQDFLAPAKARTRAGVRRVQNAARWLFRRPRRPVTIDIHSSTQTQLTDDARVTIGWGPLPDPSEDGMAFASVVHERLNRLHSMIQNDQDALVDERKARAAGDGALHSELGQEIARVEAGTQRVALGGLRLQFVGWVFLLVGILVGAIVNVADHVQEDDPVQPPSTSNHSAVGPVA